MKLAARIEALICNAAGLSVLALLLAAIFCLPAHAAEKAPRCVTRPVSTITVKVVAAEDFTRKLATRPSAERSGTPWIITTSDADSCAAWVSETAKPNVATAQLEAFIGCQGVILRSR